MTATSEETDILESLDLQEPCTTLQHKNDPPPAVFHAWFKHPLDCGCTPAETHAYLCQPCWDFFTMPGRWFHCTICGAHLSDSFFDLLIRWVRL